MEEPKKNTKDYWFKDPTFYLYFVVTYIISFAGYFVTRDKAYEWYRKYQSKLTPPNFVFMIVWPVLYTLMAIAGYDVDKNIEEELEEEIDPIRISKLRQEQTNLRILYGMQLLFNFSWSVFAFRWNDIGLALVDNAFLVIINCYIVTRYYEYSIMSFCMYLPYTIWTGFAFYLTLVIYINQNENKKFDLKEYDTLRDSSKYNRTKSNKKNKRIRPA